MKKYFVIVWLLISNCVHSSENTLLNGILSDGGITPRTPEQKQATISVSRVLNKEGLDPYSALSTVGVVGGDVWFRLFDNMEIHTVNINTKSLLNSSPLVRKVNIPTEIIKRYEDFHYDYPTEYAAKYVRGLGCFQDTPLRFGDINNDGTDEVVLFLANDIVLFSPDKERIVFSEQLSIDDWLSLEDTAEEPENKSLPAPPSYQYLSSMLMDVREYQPGYRGYSKLYFGDFDEDGNADILVWRKFYESNEQASAIKGFKKLHDNFQHYERQSGADSTGEFLVQITETGVLQNWLADAELTWQKGYPSKSECAGQEGQLIPEMHDPLLNDPDVLK